MWGRAAFGPRAVVWGPLFYRNMRGLVFEGDAEQYRSYDWTDVSFNEQMSLITHAYVRGNRDDTISVISNHCVTFSFHVI